MYLLSEASTLLHLHTYPKIPSLSKNLPLKHPFPINHHSHFSINRQKVKTSWLLMQYLDTVDRYITFFIRNILRFEMISKICPYVLRWRGKLPKGLTSRDMPLKLATLIWSVFLVLLYSSLHFFSYARLLGWSLFGKK